MSQVGVKGERDGLVITLPVEGDTPSALAALQAHLEQAGAFFRGAVVTLDVGERVLDIEALRGVQALMEQWEVRFSSLRATDEGTRGAAIAIGLELPFVVSPESSADRAQRRVAVPEESAEALLVRRTLRSGQVVRHPHAVVVLGDVNPGAEIVAGGDVVVWGSLRGLVHAGAMGDDHAIVCALKLAPTQLRISDQIAMAPDEQQRKRLRLWERLQPQGPELARLRDGKITVEAWPKGALDR